MSMLDDIINQRTDSSLQINPQQAQDLPSRQGLLTSDPTPNPTPTADLYNIASQKESGFTRTAPDGYEDVNAPINMPQGAGKAWVDGYLARQELNMSKQKLGMAQEELGWQRTDREKRRMIDDGMVEAAKKGGFNGVVDYLTTADPDRALQFTKAKLSLDKDIMQNDVMKTALPVQKAEILAQGYGVLGKMGAALLNAKPGDRESMYQQILPIIKMVNPNAPSTFGTDAAGMLLLSAAQSMSENILWGTGKQQKVLHGQIGDAIMGKNYLLNNGYSPDSPEVKAYDNVINGGGNEHERLEIQRAKVLLGYEQLKQSKINIAQKALSNINKDYIDATNTYGNFMTLYNDPARGKEGWESAVTQTVRASGEKGVQSDTDKKGYREGTGLLQNLYMNIRQQLGLPGGGTAQQWNNLKTIQTGYYQATTQAYEAKLSAWEKSMRAAGVPEENIQSLLASTKVTGAQQIQQSKAPTEDTINQQYQSAVQQVQQKYGNDKGKLMQLDQIRQQKLNELKINIGQQ